jgi:hypothetical protein
LRTYELPEIFIIASATLGVFVSLTYLLGG